MIGTDGPPTAFFVMFGLVAAVIVAIMIFTVVTIARRRRAMRAAGLDPLTADIQLIGRLAHSALLSPQQPVEARLREIDDLHSRGVITDDERAAARAKVLGGD